MLRDPVLLLPVVVAAGLAVGRLGVHGHVSGHANRRGPRACRGRWWRLRSSVLRAAALASSRWLLAAAAFAVLGADLEWAELERLVDARLPARGAVGRRSSFTLVLAFPEGRPWSRLARIAIAGAYVATLGGQLVGAFVDPNTRDVLVVAPQRDRRARGRPSAGDRRRSPSAWSCSSSCCGDCASCVGRHDASQGPLLVAAAVTASARSCVAGLGDRDRRGQRRRSRRSSRAVAVSIPVGHRRGDPLVAPASARSVRARRRAADERPATMRERLARALGDPTLEVAYRLADGRYVDAAGRPVRAARRRRPCRHRGDRRRRGGRRAGSRSGVARRAGARRVGSRHRRARARERAPGGRGAFAARRGTRVPRPDRRRGRRRAAPHRAQPPRRRAATARDVVASRSASKHPAPTRRSRRSLARTGRGRAGDRRATRARAGNPPDPAPGRGAPGGRRGARTTRAVAGDGARHGARSVCRIRSSSPPTSSSRKRSRTSSSTLRRPRHRCCSSGNRGRTSRHGRGRRSRRRPHHARLGTGRPPRPARCARRDACDRERAAVEEQPSAPRSHASRDRRRRTARPRGSRSPARPRTASRSSPRSATPMRCSRASATCGPDVALVDIRMPPTHTDEGLRAAREIRSRYPETAVLVLSQHLEPEYALRLVEEKPEQVGYLMKERVGRVEQLLDAVRSGRSGRVRRRQGRRRRAARATPTRSIRSRSSRRASARSSH